VRLRSVGVEEELLLVRPETGMPSAVAGSVLRAVEQQAAGGEAAGGKGAGEKGAGGKSAGGKGAGEKGAEPEVLEHELQQQQLETNTEPRRTLDELGREVRRCRAAAASAAAEAGAQVAALGTSPVTVDPELVPKHRYQKMAAEYGLTLRELLTGGCHVHVEVASDEEGVAVLDRIQPWLAPLLALSGNSPFWQGTDSAYASYRYQVWGRLPSAGPTGCFGTARAYHDTVRQMVRTQALLDTGMVYFDARLSEHYPTVEIRIADVCLRADDAVLIAALVRALVETAARAARDGGPPGYPRTELLRLAAWRASRSGLDDALLSPAGWQADKAGAVVAMLVEHVRDALVDAGEYDTVAGLLGTVLRRGNGAVFQRQAYARSGDLAGVVREAAAITVS
jgi:glutamate---cysteine ligase / carboxylate-amine ligase